MNRADHQRYLASLFVVLVASPLFLTVYIAVAPENFEVLDYGIWTSQLDYASTPSLEDPGVLILGDSTIHAALIPRAVAPDARSLALGGSSPIDAYHQLRRYLENHRAPDVLIVSYSPRHLAERPLTPFWKYSVRYEAHRYSEFEEVLTRSERLGVELLPGKSAARARLEWWLYRAKFPPYYIAEIKHANPWKRRRSNQAMKSKLAAARGHAFYATAEGPHPLAWEAGQGEFRVSKLRSSYLRDCFVLARRHGTQVIFASTAFSRTSMEAMAPNFAADYSRYVAELRRDHPAVRIEEGFHLLPDDHFGDHSHVNEAGARVLSARIANLVAQLREPDALHARVSPN